jgi:hypothetical protein
MTCRPTLVLACSLVSFVASADTSPPKPVTPAHRDTGTTFTSDGRLSPPADYREWIFLSSGLDMDYSDEAAGMDHSMFDNVFVDPASYRSFLQTGQWPEGTRFAKELRGAAEKGSINKHGKYQSGAPMALEVHIKDSGRFAGGWGFFVFGSVSDAPARQIPTTASCYSCHQQHGAVDTTFVQFYPTLLDIAAQKHTLSQGYRP